MLDGFYYDLDRETAFTAEDLEKIEKEMKKIVKEALPLEQIYKIKRRGNCIFQRKGGTI